MDQIDRNEIKRKSFLGVIALTSRTFALQIIALISTFILTILLDPASFGVFFVVTAAVNFLNYFSDIGLAAALIQKKEEPTVHDLATTFTIQQGLVGTAVIIALGLSGPIASFYGLGASGLFLFQSLVVSFFLSSLKTIPSVLLERKLNFQKLVIPQIVETIVFYSVAIILALRGMGVVSFAWAALARGITGTALLYLIAPWRPQFELNKESTKKLLTFGLPYQANSFLALVKDDLFTLFLGKWLPLAQIGYIGWAKKWAEIALRLIMDNIIKVTFPTYARLQHDRELLAKAIQKSLIFIALLTLPIATGMVFLVKPFIDIVPRYSKWEPALLSFYLFTFSSVLAALSSPLVNAINAVGKVKYTFVLMIIWTILTWTIIPVFITKFGFNGVALGAVVISFTSFLPLFFIRKITHIGFISQIPTILFVTFCMAVIMIMVTTFFINPLNKIIFGIIIGSVTYGTLIYIFLGKELLPYLKLIKRGSSD